MVRSAFGLNRNNEVAAALVESHVKFINLNLPQALDDRSKVIFRDHGSSGRSIHAPALRHGSSPINTSGTGGTHRPCLSTLSKSRS